MNKHVFGKYEVGFCSDHFSGGLVLEDGEWLWFTPGEADRYSTDNYGLQESNIEQQS